MSERKEFKILLGGFCIDFSKTVTEHLEDGWILHGSPFNYDGCICQAVIRSGFYGSDRGEK